MTLSRQEARQYITALEAVLRGVDDELFDRFSGCATVFEKLVHTRDPPRDTKPLQKLSHIVLATLQQNTVTINFRRPINWSFTLPAEREGDNRYALLGAVNLNQVMISLMGLHNNYRPVYQRYMKNMFPESAGWKFIDPVGDGYCGLYAVFFAANQFTDRQTVAEVKDPIINSTLARGFDNFLRLNPRSSITLDATPDVIQSKDVNQIINQMNRSGSFTLTDVLKYVGEVFPVMGTVFELKYERFYVPTITFINNNKTHPHPFKFIVVVASGHYYLIHNFNKLLYDNTVNKLENWAKVSKLNEEKTPAVILGFPFNEVAFDTYVDVFQNM